MDLIFIILISFCLGSFANVIRFRIPIQKSIISPRSFCPRCGQKIKYFDNIPVISWILLGGKCRSCSSKISITYPLVEFTLAFLIVFSILINSYIFSNNIYFNLIYLFVFNFYIFCISIIDVQTLRIHNSLIISGILLGLLFNTINTIFFNASSYILFSHFIATFLGYFLIESVTFLLYLAFSKEAFGGGDSKFLALIGTWIGIKGMFLSFLLAIYLSAVFSTFGLILKKLSKKSKLPFGPFLASGSYMVLIMGIQFWEDILIGFPYLHS